jgi:hypothetical protein
VYEQSMMVMVLVVGTFLGLLVLSLLGGSVLLHAWLVKPQPP